MGVEFNEKIIADIKKYLSAEILRERCMTHKSGFLQPTTMRKRTRSDDRYAFGNNDFGYIRQESKCFGVYSRYSRGQHVLAHICGIAGKVGICLDNPYRILRR
jgi:hypothetical protein